MSFLSPLASKWYFYFKFPSVQHTEFRIICTCFSLSGSTEIVHDKQAGQLTVNANVPNHGEYAVWINAKDKKDKTAKKAKPVVGYLITTKVDEDDSKLIL